MTDRRFQQVSIVNPNFNYEEWIKYPEPNDVPEFLENPYKFCPKEEWITSTTVEVSPSFPFNDFSLTLFSLGRQHLNPLYQTSKCRCGRCVTQGGG